MKNGILKRMNTIEGGASMNAQNGIRIFVLWIVLMLIPMSTFASSPEQMLREDWAFYNEQLFETVPAQATKTATVELPLEFSSITGDVSGYGTFVKYVDVPTSMQHELLALHVPFTYSAAKIYINGELYREVGRVGTTAATHERNLQSVLIAIQDVTETLEIVIQVSSFDHIRGGFSAPPTLGEWEAMHGAFVTERYAAIFIATIIFIAGLITLAIGLLERKERMFLTFGLFALVVAARGVVAVPFIYHDLPFQLSYEWATRLEYFTTNVCFMLYAMFIYLLYDKLFSKWILYPGIAVLSTLAVLSLVADVVTFQEAFFSTFAAMGVFILYNIWIMVRAFFSNLVLAKSLLLGVLFVLIGLIIDFLTGMGILYAPPLANFMIAMNVLIVLLSLCYNYVSNMRIVTQLNNQLDEEVKARTAELNAANKELQRLVQIDGLTGAYNRHKFDQSIKEEFKHACQMNVPLSLLMIDLDEFKKYNDYYGHVKGDELLIFMARLMKEKVPQEAIFARYGGEEFAVILPTCTISEAIAIGETLCKFIESVQWEHLGRSTNIVTISVGCAECLIDAVEDEIALIELADARLYHSKRSGRNQVTASGASYMKSQ